MASLFLLEIYMEPHDAADNVLNKTVQAIDQGLADVKGSYLQLFQVTGEDTIVIVLGNGVQAVKQEVRKAVGKLVRFKCTPIRAYENFARMLGVSDEELLSVKSDLSGEGQLYWLHARVEYEGLGSLDELFRRWKIEALTALNNRASGAKIVPYKTVFEREVHMFTKAPNGDALDELLPTLPMFKEMGDQIFVKCKGLEFIK